MFFPYVYRLLSLHSLLFSTAMCRSHAASLGWNVKGPFPLQIRQPAGNIWYWAQNCSAALTSMLPPRGYAWCSSQHLLLSPESLPCSCPPSLWISPSFPIPFPSWFSNLAQICYSPGKSYGHSNLHIHLHPRFVQHSPNFLFWSLVMWLFQYIMIISVPDTLTQNCEPLESLSLVWFHLIIPVPATK